MTQGEVLMLYSIIANTKISGLPTIDSEETYIYGQSLPCRTRGGDVLIQIDYMSYGVNEKSGNTRHVIFRLHKYVMTVSLNVVNTSSDIRDQFQGPPKTIPYQIKSNSRRDSRVFT